MFAGEGTRVGDGMHKRLMMYIQVSQKKRGELGGSTVDSNLIHQGVFPWSYYIVGSHIPPPYADLNHLEGQNMASGK